LRGGASTRFHPKRRASTDHRPGPNIATAAPTVPSKRGTQWSPVVVIICQVSAKAIKVPAMGVHSPGISSKPNPARNAEVTIVGIGGSRHSKEVARTTTADPATRRRRSRPVPGQPAAKVEYRRRTTYLSKLPLFLDIAKENRNPKRGRDRHSLEIWSSGRGSNCEKPGR